MKLAQKCPESFHIWKRSSEANQKSNCFQFKPFKKRRGIFPISIFRCDMLVSGKCTVPFATKVKGSNLPPHKKSQFTYIGSPTFGMLSKEILLKLKKNLTGRFPIAIRLCGVFWGKFEESVVSVLKWLAFCFDTKVRNSEKAWGSMKCSDL